MNGILRTRRGKCKEAVYKMNRVSTVVNNLKMPGIFSPGAARNWYRRCSTGRSNHSIPFVIIRLLMSAEPFTKWTFRVFTAALRIFVACVNSGWMNFRARAGLNSSELKNYRSCSYWRISGVCIMWEVFFGLLMPSW
jgi:hypothetical protein